MSTVDPARAARRLAPGHRAETASTSAPVVAHGVGRGSGVGIGHPETATRASAVRGEPLPPWGDHGNTGSRSWRTDDRVTVPGWSTRG